MFQYFVVICANHEFSICENLRNLWIKSQDNPQISQIRADLLTGVSMEQKWKQLIIAL